MNVSDLADSFTLSNFLHIFLEYRKETTRGERLSLRDINPAWSSRHCYGIPLKMPASLVSFTSES